MKYLLVVAALLAGCACNPHAPDDQLILEVPPQLLKAPEPLKQL